MADVTLAHAVDGKLSAEEKKRLDWWRWHDRLVSLWAPVTVLAIVFGVYLVIVESAVCSYPWLQPVMQAVGLLCFAWWAALVVARTPVMKAWNEARKQRYRAEEVLGEVESLANRHRTKLKDKEWEDLVEACAALVKAFGPAEAPVSGALKALEAAYDRHLKRHHQTGLLDLGSGFARALFIALAFRAVLIEPFKIPSGSMIPTLEIGDQIFVNKFIYGVRLPFTNYVPFVLVREPKRGDVIVFNNPTNESVDYIKRVVGLPGDVLEFTEEGVQVNGKPLPRELESEHYRYWDQYSSYGEPLMSWVRRWNVDDWHEREESLYRETFEGVPHLIFDNSERRVVMLSRQQVRTVTVPEKSVFVMGDNRNNSEDSRFGLGSGSGLPEFVPFGHIKGKATVIWLSLSHGGFLANLFGGTGIRYDRFFLPVTMCGNEAPRR